MRYVGWTRVILTAGGALCFVKATACADTPQRMRDQTNDVVILSDAGGGDSHSNDAGGGGSESDGAQPSTNDLDSAAATTGPDSSVTDSEAGASFEDASTPHPDAGSPIVAAEVVAHVIFDSDMSSDWDDVGDIAVLHGLAAYGQIDILAMGVSSLNGGTAMCMDAINTYYGKPDIPIGVRPDVGGVGAYAAQIASEFPHGPEKNPKDFQLAVDVYRKVLAAQPDKTVTFVTTGYLTNLKALLQSPPDQFSPLSGRELIAKKVKLLSCAGGSFPSGDEFNFRASGDDSAYAVLNDWPAQVAYVGFDIGQVIHTAGRLPDAPAANPIRRVYVDIEKQYPYPSWGQIAVYYAARPAEGLWGAVKVGHNTVDKPGHNAWATDSDPSGDLEQSYLLEKVRSPVREALDALMMLAPNDGKLSKPGDPSNLRATVVSAGRIDLQWTDNAFNEGGFSIERGTNGIYAPVGTTAANVVTFSDTGTTSTANVSYRVKAINSAGDSQYSTVWLYSGWTEINFANPGALPLYSYYQFSNLRWARGGDFRPDHAAVNDDSEHGQDVKIRVDVASLGSEGAFNVYFFYQDPNNWYRLTTDASKSAFERKIGGTLAQVGAAGPGVNIGNGSNLARWQIESTSNGSLKFSADAATVLQASESLRLARGKIGLGGVARTPVWESFRFETSP
jgi:hypothetical protein